MQRDQQREWRLPPEAEPQAVKRLSANDQRYFDSADAKLQVVRDRVAGVGSGLHTGLHLYGDPGIGKTYTVVQQLEAQKVPFLLTNSRVTGRGLFDLLARYPEEVHVFDDVESLTRDVQGAGVLRAGLWSVGHRNKSGRAERIITWETHRSKLQVSFTGGIILIGNRPLDDLPELEALKTRITTIHLQASDREVAALMRALAMQGHRHGNDFLMEEECSEVCEFVISESRRLQKSLNMRDMVNGFADFLQWRACDTGCHWHDLVGSRLRERPVVEGGIEWDGMRARRKQYELQVAREIADLPREERLRAWKAKTKKSEAALYRRLQELAETDGWFWKSDETEKSENEF